MWVGRVKREVSRVGDHCGQWPLAEIRKRLQEGVAYNFDSAVPGTGAKCVLRHQIPVHCKDFSVMLFPASNWELV